LPHNIVTADVVVVVIVVVALVIMVFALVIVVVAAVIVIIIVTVVVIIIIVVVALASIVQNMITLCLFGYLRRKIDYKQRNSHITNGNMHIPSSFCCLPGCPLYSWNH